MTSFCLHRRIFYTFLNLFLSVSLLSFVSIFLLFSALVFFQNVFLRFILSFTLLIFSFSLSFSLFFHISLSSLLFPSVLLSFLSLSVSSLFSLCSTSFGLSRYTSSHEALLFLLSFFLPHRVFRLPRKKQFQHWLAVWSVI